MRYLSFAAVAVLLAGCAQLSADGGMTDVAHSVQQQIGKEVVKISTDAQAGRAREQVTALLGGTLSTEQAVQIALLNNRSLQAAYNDLGISEAEYVQASLPPNPALSLMRIAGTGVANFEARLVGDILNLITLPKRTAIAAERFGQARYRAIGATLRLAAETRRAYVRAIVSRQQVGFLEQTRATADAAARLIAGMGEAGGGDQLDQAEIAAFRAEIGTRVEQAKLQANRDHEALVRLLGLSGAGLVFRLPPELPPLPPSLDTMNDLEVEAIRRRVDLEIARREVAALAKSLSLTEATRYISMLQLAGIFNNETANPLTNFDTAINRGGAQIDLQIPIFDTGEARTRAARETYMQALNLLAGKAVDARSEARIAYVTYRATYDIARSWRDRVLPLRQRVSKEIMLRYTTGVLAGEGLRVDLFKYLADTRVRIAANAASLDAQRDFLVAVIDLEAVLTIGGEYSSSSAPAARTPTLNMQ
ncbi:MAG: TolC family protein [Rhodospirillales bacterium]|nr:TolC family protein [Rhodospirillales bacterium]